ncbi:hypothetical protein [Dapis sp. BLCC M229]|uniref:hypothetical protein n=1 Tax=Dapis sp. BLCC M229 TaxID=3400188 RepID=UPI003CE82ED5
MNTDENSQGNFEEQISSWQVEGVIVYSGFALTPDSNSGHGKSQRLRQENLMEVVGMIGVLIS